MQKLSAVVAGAILALATSNAFSLPLNERPDMVYPVSGLQARVDGAISSTSKVTLDVAKGQSDVANWTLADSGSSIAYMVSLAAPTTETSYFGIYSAKTGQKYDLLNETFKKQRGFTIDEYGTLTIGNVEEHLDFGTAFGFYFGSGSTGARYFTEDSLNGGEIHSVVYDLADAISFKSIGTTSGGDDWIMAFRNSASGDFIDGIYLVKDLSPVPEPGTMVLLGAGFLGIAISSKRRKNSA